MNPKQYLSQALSADKAINRKIDRLADLYAACTKSTSLLTLTPGGGHDDRAFEHRMEKYLLLRDEINADIDRLVDLKTEIMMVIDAVPDEDDRCVLEKHFLQGKSYTVIGQEMKYDKDYVYKKIKKALKKIQIPESVL
jgi:DNA-directed RNA polymerase specialized sigma subunit